MDSEIDVEELMELIRRQALALIEKAEFWEIRIHGGNGKARVEVIQQVEPVRYLRPRGGKVITTRK